MDEDSIQDVGTGVEKKKLKIKKSKKQKVSENEWRLFDVLIWRAWYACTDHMDGLLMEGSPCRQPAGWEKFPYGATTFSFDIK